MRWNIFNFNNIAYLEAWYLSIAQDLETYDQEMILSKDLDRYGVLGHRSPTQKILQKGLR
jgi:hypothetical protein